MEPTPFHEGELALQEKLGVKEMVHGYAPRVIRPYMPEQHREFYASLPQFFLASTDKAGMPWASVLFGESGFVSSPTPTMLTLSLLPDAADPLMASLVSGSEVGMVGLQVETRRRNRVNGRIGSVRNDGFDIHVTQSFGNCPQYIQRRDFASSQPVQRSLAKPEFRQSLTDTDQAIIEAADTFYIASASSNLGYDERHGVDMSHRGGAPGFVKILEDKSLLFPDFSGNNHYNTLGNISVNPYAGLLFLDYETGSILQLSGRAEIIWPEDSFHAYDGATKYVRIIPELIVLRPNAIPYVWKLAERSPFLPQNARWHDLRQEAVKGARAYRVADKVQEADDISSIYLMPVDGDIPDYEAGQHLPIAVDMAGQTVRRTYTLSAAPRNGGALRLSVKALPGGSVSRYINHDLSVGSVIEARAPGGDFVLASKQQQPSVFISAGIGITPMIAMAEKLLIDGSSVPVHFVHASVRPSGMAFLSDLRRWQQQYPHFLCALTFDAVDESDVAVIPNARAGRADVAWLEDQQLPANGAFYLCGPKGFMQFVYDWLIEKGIPDSQIHFEAFGPSSLKRSTKEVHRKSSNIPVRFKGKKDALVWDAAQQTLLELAEDNGIDAPFSCRSGSCGSCAVKLLEGKVSYEKTPAYPIDDGMVLLCCAVPDGNTSGESLLLEL